jgi:signal peptidase
MFSEPSEMKLPEIFKRDYMTTVVMILVVILIVFTFWFSLRFIFRTEHPILAVASGSMEPVLYRGDLILVEGIQNLGDIYAAPKDADPPGDIIVFQGTSDLIVHRAVERNVNGDGTYSFKTWGDNNGFPDSGIVQGSDVVGRYTGFKIPLLGHIALFFNPFEVKVAFIALWIIALILLEFYPVLRKRLKRGDGEESLYK